MSATLMGTSRGSRATLSLPALALQQNGYRIYVTGIRADDLSAFTRIDRFDPTLEPDNPKQGYQRKEDMPRVKKLGNWLRKQLEDDAGVLMPTAILTSTRNSRVDFDEATRTITLHRAAPLYVVDGQHRRAGLRYAIEEKSLEALRDFDVPLIIVEDLTREIEMQQFAVVNGTQKGVRTDLVNMILTQLTAAKGDDVIEEKDQWKVVVSRTIAALNEDRGGPWEHRIIMPNERTFTKAEEEARPELKGQQLVRATSFMTSLRPIYDYLRQYFETQNLTLEERAQEMAQVITAFWRAVRTLNPDAFETPDEFVLQKTPGIFALHRMCARLLPTMHIAARKWDEENFHAVLEPCSELANPDYWNAENGEAAKYGSMKGFAELAELLEESRIS
jgi:DGQHR domain-containing protein